MTEQITDKGSLIAATRKSNTAAPGLVYAELRGKLKTDIKTNRLRLREVCKALESFGYVESTQTLSNKLRSGKFSAAYYWLLTKAIEKAGRTKI